MSVKLHRAHSRVEAALNELVKGAEGQTGPRMDRLQRIDWLVRRMRDIGDALEKLVLAEYPDGYTIEQVVHTWGSEFLTEEERATIG